MQVKNQNCIRRLSWKSMSAARPRNTIAILAIALTTILFTALFTIALSINHSFQEANFRQVGGWSHGGFKYLTEEQFQEIKNDPLIKEYGLRRFIGMPADVPFNKSHVEVGYSDATQAHWMYCDPIEGRLPQEGTNEAATDTKVLSLLGVEPVLGTEFTITFHVDGQDTTQTFTLSGWWDYDEAIVANHVLIPQSRVNDILTQLNTQCYDGITGTWNMDVMLADAMHIEQDLNTVLMQHGYQTESRSEDNFINIGVNWGYTGAQLSSNIDPMTIAAIVILLLIIVFTGYLIIYNVFQISVTNDIRFYGLLKTIGTTGRQIKRMIRQQALLLSLVGIPVGLFFGYIIGIKLTPVILSRLNGVVVDVVSANPLIFIGAAIFSLFTVIISCRKPGRMAAKVSPVEAVRYTEGSGESRKTKKHYRKSKNGASVFKMAWVNLGRSRSKTVVTIASLSLAVVLLNLTVTFTNGFDMDKYIKANVVTDFIVADAGYFQTSGSFFNRDMCVTEDFIAQVQAQGGIAEGGKIYGRTSYIQEFITEAYYRNNHGRWFDEATLNANIANLERNETGAVADTAQLFGMEPFVIDKLNVLDGDLEKLKEPGGNYIAAVYNYDDYGKPYLDSHWAKLGDTVTLRYVEEFEYFDPATGAILDPGNLPNDFSTHAKSFRDVQYEVVALVGVPNALSYRYYGADEFVLNDQTFIRDTGTDCVMQYSFNMVDAQSNAAMENFLADFTENQQSQFDYESKLTYVEQFQSFQSMFLILGGVLSAIIGLVGILNFFNAILTGILVRRREFAVLQSIGMTGKQLKTMLIWEGVYYALMAILISMILSLITGPLVSVALSGMFWFFTYRFTIAPVLCLAPVFILLGVVLPLIMYRFVAKHSVVERLRQID